MDTYNGWSNYETWNVALWMGNDGSDYWAERAQECFDATDEEEAEQARKDEAATALANEIENSHDEALGEVKGLSGCFADILNAGMRSVDWREIAENLLSDVAVQS